MGHTLPILGSFRICKMGLIIVLISYGVLKHPRTVPGTEEALYKCKSQNKVKYTCSFIEYLLCAGHGLGVLLPEDGARPLPSRSPHAFWGTFFLPLRMPPSLPWRILVHLPAPWPPTDPVGPAGPSSPLLTDSSVLTASYVSDDA